MTDSDESDEQRPAKALPPAAPLPDGDPTRVHPPTAVTVSFGLWLLAGLVLILGFGLTLTARQQIIDTLIEMNNDQRITNDQIASGTTSLLWTLFVGAIVFGVLFGLFAYKTREGTRSARTVLTVLAAVVLIFQVVLFSNLVTLASALVTIVATVLLYLPNVQGYFAKPSKAL
ncbi:hypothetical protein ABZ863_01165 [Saccharomonospora sp. NPDC046836]|uniref:hypothetical protein n=1 Tax=Saccharomonospora sp. NPDC046836 TaxID=3156921 RepID=UPI0033D77605